MNSKMPPNLTESIPIPLIGDAELWWESLDESERSELVKLCDSRREVFLFETFSGENSPKVTGGKFVPKDDAFGINDWGEDYFQHLLDHPELMIVYDTDLRTFHIGCSRHIDARKCFVDGSVDQHFDCPFQKSDCLMRTVLGRRESVGLRPILGRASLTS